jgi:hypothetical protein
VAQDRIAGAQPDRDDRHACGDLRRNASAQQPGLERACERAEPEPPPTRLLRAWIVAVECTRERVAPPEDQALGRRHGDAEVIGHLLIGQSLPVAEQNRQALRLGKARECVLEAEQLVSGFSARGDLGQPVRIVRKLDFTAALAGIPT